MDPTGFIFLFVVMLLSYIALKFVMFQRARREAELINHVHDESATIENRTSQTYIISPIYTIDSNREPLPYEAALAMPRTLTRSTENTNKSYDDDLPSYDQAIIYSKPIETINEITLNVPKSVTNAAVR